MAKMGDKRKLSDWGSEEVVHVFALFDKNKDSRVNPGEILGLIQVSSYFILNVFSTLYCKGGIEC